MLLDVIKLIFSWLGKWIDMLSNLNIYNTVSVMDTIVASWLILFLLALVKWLILPFVSFANPSTSYIKSKRYNREKHDKTIHIDFNKEK